MNSHTTRAATIRQLHLALCAVVAVTVSFAIEQARLGWLFPAVAAILGSVALTFVPDVSALETPAPPVVVRSARDRPRARPSYHAFVRGRLGNPLHARRFLFNFLIRPLLAPTFAQFWWYWNPPYAYVLRYYVYARLRRRMPHGVAQYLTFLASGFFLHDLPFNLPADLAHGVPLVPSVTILFAMFGGLTWLSQFLRIDLSQSRSWLRVCANLAWIAAAFIGRSIVLRFIGA